MAAQYRHYVKARPLKKAHFQRHFSWLERHIAPPGKLLDIGCAAGFAIEVACDRGWDARGIELNEWFAQFTDPAVRGRVCYRPLERSGLTDRFNVITMFDLLEHSSKPRALLNDARALLAPGGVIALQLPFVDSLACRALGRRWYHYNPPAHLSYFSLATLERLARGLDLTLLEQRWIGKLFSADYLSLQLADAYLPRWATSRGPGSGARGAVTALDAIRGRALQLLGRLRFEVPMSERFVLLADRRRA
jgi:SAM-dependent methyltransferase